MLFGQLGCKSPLVRKAIFESDARKKATSNLTAGHRFGVRHTSQTLAFECWSMASGGKNRARCKPRITPVVSQSAHTCKPRLTRPQTRVCFRIEKTWLPENVIFSCRTSLMRERGEGGILNDNELDRLHKAIINCVDYARPHILCEKITTLREK